MTPHKISLKVKFTAQTKPDGRVGRAGAPQSYSRGFNPHLGPIWINSKIFRVFIQIFVINVYGPSCSLRVMELDT